MLKSLTKHTLVLVLLCLTVQCTDETVPPEDGVDGLQSIVNLEDELTGENCQSGGIRISAGLDVNSNGLLDDNEINATSFICNGLNGASSAAPLLATTPTEDPGENCEFGGVHISVGTDQNLDGLLDTDEVQSSFYICNGADGTSGSDGSGGFSSITRATPESTGDNCSNAGLKIEVGLDANGNGNLDTEEIQYTYFVCNGLDGSDGSNGTNGRNSLISISPFSGNQNGCLNGGLTINTGIDDNSDGALQAKEIDATSHVCNGGDGTNGNSDDVYEFYFSEDFDGYKGVRDVAISDENPTETGEMISVEEGAIDYHGLLYFPEIDKVQSQIGTSAYQIVEAVLYLRGASSMVDATQDNWLGVKNQTPSAPLFVEEEATWTQANNTPQFWSSPGASTTEEGGAYGYSDMFRLPFEFTFEGYIPLLLNRSEIASWAQDPSNNKGLVLEMVKKGELYGLDIFSSNYSKDIHFRPTLYIKAKIISAGRSEHISDQEYKANWESKSYNEKLEPLFRK
ncbi:MAG: hypothetical protein ABJG78_14225 [Cyclobacteriaceae bacterium]